MPDKFYDDKLQVIWCVTIIAIFSMCFLDTNIAATATNSVISGLFGVAVGKSL